MWEKQGNTISQGNKNKMLRANRKKHQFSLAFVMSWDYLEYVSYRNVWAGWSLQSL